MDTGLARIDTARGLEPRDATEALAVAATAAKSGLFPDLRSPEAAYVILATGRELGLTAMQSLRGIVMVKGRPTLSADTMVAVVLASGLCLDWHTVESTDALCTVATTRRGQSERRCTWTAEQATKAGLGGDVWSKYRRVMLRHRAAAELAREVYPDLLLGVYSEGEIPDTRTAPAAPIDAEPEPSEPTALADYLDALEAAASVWAVWSAYVDLPDALRAEGLDPTVSAPGARDAAASRLRWLGLLLTAAELQTLLGAQDAGDLARALDAVRALPARDPAAAARWWVAARGALPVPAAKLCYTVAARRAAGAEVIDAATTKAAKVALAAAVAALDAPPPRGGVPVPEAPVAVTASAAAREPGDDTDSEAAASADGWQRTAEGRAAYAAGMESRTHLLRAARKHCQVPSLAGLLAARLAALTPADQDGAVLSLETALAQVNGEMARGQRDRRASSEATRRTA